MVGAAPPPLYVWSAVFWFFYFVSQTQTPSPDPQTLSKPGRNDAIVSPEVFPDHADTSKSLEKLVPPIIKRSHP